MSIVPRPPSRGQSQNPVIDPIDGSICCPICGEWANYWRPDGVDTSEASVEIAMEGECGHRFRLVLRFHEGQSFLRVEQVERADG